MKNEGFYPFEKGFSSHYTNFHIGPGGKPRFALVLTEMTEINYENRYFLTNFGQKEAQKRPLVKFV